jgi:TadE-like protein
MGKVTMSKQTRYPGWRRKLQRGQSLMELALSLTVLVLVVSGVVDLGRAFFTKITLDSAISEGAHWLAAYPGCAMYGIAFGDGSNVVNAPPHCKGTNSITRRIRNESNLLIDNPTTNCCISKISLILPSGKRADEIVPGDTLKMRIEYKMPLLTPVMKALFGDVFILATEAEEVIRGNDLPETEGKPYPLGPQTVPPRVTNLLQNSVNPPPVPLTKPAERCSEGFPPLSWTSPGPAAVDGYEISVMDAGTGLPLTPPPGAPWTNPIIETKTTVAAAGQTDLSWIKDPNLAPQIAVRIKGGNQLYAVRSFKNGPPKTYSDYLYYVGTCPVIQPIPVSAVCDPAPPARATRVIFTWNMPDGFAWTSGIGPDEAIWGYQLWYLPPGAPAGSPGTVLQQLTTNRDTFTGSYTFNDGTPPSPPGDPLRTTTYRVKANDMNGAPLGQFWDPSLDWQVDCPY